MTLFLFHFYSLTPHYSKIPLAENIALLRHHSILIYLTFLYKQNVYLTCSEENLNNSNIIFSIDGIVINEPDNWNRCIYIFNEQNLKVTDELESYKREIKDLGYTLKSFEQDNNGKWISNN